MGTNYQQALAELYRKKPTEEIQADFQAHIKTSPGEYDPRGAWDSTQNLTYRDWYRKKIAFEELLSARKIERMRARYVVESEPEIPDIDRESITESE